MLVLSHNILICIVRTHSLGSCSKDTDPVFSNNDACYIGTQYYCCPKPVQLKDCRWEDGSKGTDCVNAVCKDNELELERAQYGEWGTIGCSWGRKKAACCTVDKPPPKPAYCTSNNVCKTVPEFCNGGAKSLARRDALGQLERTVIQVRQSEEARRRASAAKSVLEKRGNAETYYVDLGNNVGIRIIALAYPGLAEIFGLHGGSRVLRRFFRLIAGYCTGPAIQEGRVGPGDNPGGMEGLDAEHPIDVSYLPRYPICPWKCMLIWYLLTAT